MVKPEVCVSIRTRDERLTALPANAMRMSEVNCIAVKTEGKEVGRGRLVVATSQAVVCFDPKTRAVQRIPVADATIHALGSLDKPFADGEP